MTTKTVKVPGLNLHFNADKEEYTESLICAHCRIPHSATEEMIQRYRKQAEDYHVGLDQIWECGKCYLAHLSHLTKLPAPPMKTECTHEVPPFPEDGKELVQ